MLHGVIEINLQTITLDVWQAQLSPKFQIHTMEHIVTKKVSPIPRGYRTATTCLTVFDVDSAVAFYQAAFGAELLVRHAGADEAVAVSATIKIGNSISSGSNNNDDDSVRKSRIKTEMCMHYANGRPCPFGANCTYAHGEEELQMTRLLDLHKAGLVDLETYRTRPCLTFISTGAW